MRLNFLLAGAIIPCMSQTATITSKRQITIPSKLFKEIGLKEGEKIIVSEKDGDLVLTPAVKLVKKLAGSIKVPKKWKGKDIDEIIEEAKYEYFRSKYYKRKLK